jgi:hypothetical protein
MRIPTRLTTACLLLVLPTLAFAADRCEHSAPRNADLNLSGIRTVVFDIGPHRLELNASDTASGTIRGRACASDPQRLAELTVTQQREGDRLIVRAERNGLLRKGSWSGRNYGYLRLKATLPEDSTARIKLGAGEATVDGLASASGDVGSGSMTVRNIRGSFFADVGSGSLQAANIGALHIVSIGSGQLTARNVGGDVRVGDIGSGSLNVIEARGRVDIGDIGSGAADLSAIGGAVRVDDIASGGLNARGVGGDLTVVDIGSGSVSHRDVVGRVSLPKTR